MQDLNAQQSDFLLYTSPDGEIKIDVFFENETVWLTQIRIAELFQTTKQNISLHLKNIFTEIELDENSVVKEYLTTATDGKKYRTKFYNLDAIISVGYRVNSEKATHFRIWATKTLREWRCGSVVIKLSGSNSIVNSVIPAKAEIHIDFLSNRDNTQVL